MRGRWKSGIYLLVLPLLLFVLKTTLQNTIAVQSSKIEEQKQVDELRLQLLMGLDLLVRSERSLQREQSGYTKSLGRVPDVLGGVTAYYRVEIAHASQKNLIVVAYGDSRGHGALGLNGIIGDRVAIDDQFSVRTNFPVPTPPRGYLTTLAKNVMNEIYSNQFEVPARQRLDTWEGVYRGFFRYEIRPVSQGGRTIVAVGLRAPVEGEVIEMERGADLFSWVYEYRQKEWINYELAGQLENVYLAERIHKDHTGSYAPTFKSLLPNWNHLSSLSIDHAPIMVQEFQLDPTFGFQVELTETADPKGDAQDVVLSPRAWSVNGYGQISPVSTVESLVSRLQDTAKRGPGSSSFGVNVSGSVGARQKVSSDVSGSEISKISSDQISAKPLLIDVVDSKEVVEEVPLENSGSP